MSASAAPTIKAALVTALTTLYAAQSPPVPVLYGSPGPWEYDDYVCVGGVQTTARFPVLAAGTRPVEEDHRITLVVCSARKGTQSVQQVATERAYALFDLLHQYLLVAGQEALAGARSAAFPIAYDLVEPDDDAIRAVGRAAVLTVTIGARSRI